MSKPDRSAYVRRLNPFRAAWSTRVGLLILALVLVVVPFRVVSQAGAAPSSIHAAVGAADTATPSPTMVVMPIASSTVTPITSTIVLTGTATMTPTATMTSTVAMTPTVTPVVPIATATPVITSTSTMTTTATLVVHNQRRTVIGGRTTPCDLAGNTNGAIEEGCEVVSSIWVPGATVDYTLSFSDGSTLTFSDTADARGHSLHPFAIAYRPAAGTSGRARSVAYIKVSATAPDGTTVGPTTVRFAVAS
jgi:hypothetical protein